MQRRRDRGRMMREVVDHGHAALHAAHFHPPLDALEGLESLLDLLVGDAAQPRDDGVGERVEHVVASGERRLEPRPLPPFPPRRELRPFRMLGYGYYRQYERR